VELGWLWYVGRCIADIQSVDSVGFMMRHGKENIGSSGLVKDGKCAGLTTWFVVAITATVLAMNDSSSKPVDRSISIKHRMISLGYG